MSDIDDIRNWQAHVSSPAMTDESAWITFCGDLADEIERLRDALMDLFNYADRHRISYSPDDMGYRACGCNTDCYERWKIESDEARRLTKEADG